MICRAWHDLEGFRLLSNKFHGLSPSGGHHSLLLDQGFQKLLDETDCSAIWRWLERHLMVFCIDEILPSYVVVQLNNLNKFWLNVWIFGFFEPHLTWTGLLFFAFFAGHLNSTTRLCCGAYKYSVVLVGSNYLKVLKNQAHFSRYW